MKIGGLPYSLPLVTWPRFEDLRYLLAEIRTEVARQREIDQRALQAERHEFEMRRLPSRSRPR